MKLSAVRQAIADALGTISGLRVYPYNPDNPQVPCAIVEYPQEWEYDTRFASGSAGTEIPVLVLVGAANDRASQTQLDGFIDYVGTTSLKAAIETHTALSGVALRVARAAEFSRYGAATGTQYLGCRIYVKVYG